MEQLKVGDIVKHHRNGRGTVIQNYEEHSDSAYKMPLLVRWENQNIVDQYIGFDGVLPSELEIIGHEILAPSKTENVQEEAPFTSKATVDYESLYNRSQRDFESSERELKNAYDTIYKLKMALNAVL